jgi:hypothetical protein
VEFKKFLVAIGKAVPPELDVHLVCVNLATHKTPAIRDWLGRHPRGPSALHPDRLLVDQAGRALVRVPHRPGDPPWGPQERPGPRKDVRAWIGSWNENPRPFTWTKTAEEILNSLGEYTANILGAGH